MTIPYKGRRIMDYKQELATLRSVIYELQERFDALLLVYRNECKHTNVEHTKRYYSGGYDYSAETHHTYTCKDCGFSEHKIENHNSGFE